MEPSERPAFDRFLEAFQKDGEANQTKSLEEYLDQFGGDQCRITAAYREFTANSDRFRTATKAQLTDLGVAPKSVNGSPRCIGPYRVLRELGRSTRSTVYLAVDVRSGLTVSLRIVSPLTLFTVHELDRLHRESEVVANLGHFAICPVFDIGCHGDDLFIATKFIEGDTLAVRIHSANGNQRTDGAKHVILPEVAESSTTASSAESPDTPAPPIVQAGVYRIVRFFETVARALHSVHEAGVIHREINPGSIMITPEGSPVILDFGLPEDHDSDSAADSTASASTELRYYSSPEQIDGRRTPLDRRTDVWSLGVSLYESLTLARPFDGQTPAELSHAILAKEPIRIRKLNPAVPDNLRLVVNKAINKDRDRRYQTALGFADDLRRAVENRYVYANPPSVFDGFRRWANRTPSRPVTVISILVALLVIGLLLRSDAVQPLAPIHVALGVGLQQKGLFREAAAEYREAIRLSPGEVMAHANLAGVLATTGQFDEAIDAAREAIRLDPKVAVAHVNLGVALRCIGNLYEAESEFREAIRIDPDRAIVHVALSDCLFDMGALEESIKAARKALRIDPTLATPHLLLGLAFHQQNLREDAINELRAAISLDPKLDAARRALDLALAAKGPSATFPRALETGPRK